MLRTGALDFVSFRSPGKQNVPGSVCELPAASGGVPPRGPGWRAPEAASEEARVCSRVLTHAGHHPCVSCVCLSLGRGRHDFEMRWEPRLGGDGQLPGGLGWAVSHAGRTVGFWYLCQARAGVECRFLTQESGAPTAAGVRESQQSCPYPYPLCQLNRI